MKTNMSYRSDVIALCKEINQDWEAMTGNYNVSSTVKKI